MISILKNIDLFYLPFFTFQKGIRGHVQLSMGVHESLELPNKIHCARFTDLRQSEISHIRDLPIKYRSLGKMGYLGLFED